jgi:threonyl-tRNA synthetase
MQSSEKDKLKQLGKIRHSLAHLLALAVAEKFPGVKLGIGPAIENGFYYDFDLKKLAETDLPKIEERVRELIGEELKFKKETLTYPEAKKIFKDQPYKLELLAELRKAKTAISVYEIYRTKPSQPLFTDLCAGPHVKSTREIDPKSFKLTTIAGAYWRGDEKNPQMQRIYGLAFDSGRELKEYEEQAAEAERRDHRRLGAELELFLLSDEVGQGLPIYLPKGAMLRHLIMDFALNTYFKNGYQPVATPHIASEKLWSHSGHLGFYKDSMFAGFGIEGENYRLKPMNCPLHIQIYKNKPRSYRDLPIRYTEMGTVYRYERSGTLHGLTRVRGLTQDDAHIICSKEQMPEEIRKALKLTLYMLTTFGFKDFEVTLSVRDPKKKTDFIGADRDWKRAEEALKYAMKETGFPSFEYDIGGAAFYGPKVDVKVKDAIGRKWQLSTIQLDFNLPHRFGMTYVNEKGKEEEPVMIHRALLGSLDRFMGVFIEHTAGAFPLWLAPVQIRVMAISDKFSGYAEKITEELKADGFRTEMTEAGETIGKRIREAELQKIPYVLVVGAKEKDEKTVSVRHYRRGQEGATTLADFSARARQEIEQKI